MDSARSALLESSIEQCKDKIIVCKMQIKDQQEVIDRVQQQIENCTKKFTICVRGNYETKEMVDQNVNTSDTEIKKIIKTEKSSREQAIEKPKPAHQNTIDGNKNQAFIRMSQEEQSFPQWACDVYFAIDLRIESQRSCRCKTKEV